MELFNAPSSVTLGRLDDEKFRRTSTSKFAGNRWQLWIPAGLEITKPLRLCFTSGDSVHIEIGDDANVMIIEECLMDATKEWEHSVGLRLGTDASVSYIAVQTMENDVHCDIKHRAEVGAGASIHWHLATLGGKNVDHAVRSQAQGDGALSSIDWLFYASQKNEQHLSVRNVFVGRDGSGEVTMRGVAQDHAHARATGTIEIGEQGRGTNTYLTQAVLMLDPSAKVDAIPALEIKTNDVKASHSATVARVSEDDLFYFSSRGIDHVFARQMLVEGFLGDLVQKMPDASVREVVMQALERKYRQHTSPH